MGQSLRTTFLMGFLIVLAACGSDERQNTDTTTPETSARGGPASDRVSLKGMSLSLVADEESKIDDHGLYFKYLVSAEAPKGAVTGDPLQATSFDFFKDYAVVSYMMAGESLEGAIDIVWINGLAWADILGSLSFKDAEFADIKVRETSAFAVGASNGEHEGAVLVVVDFSDPRNPIEVSRLSLGGFFATSIEIDSENGFAYVVSGANHGLSVVDISDVRAPRIVNEVGLSNALSAIRYQNRSLVISKNEFFWEKEGELQSAGLVGPDELFAPARMDLQKNFLFSNANQSGLQIFDLDAESVELAKLGSLALPGTGNGIDALYRFAFLAQGESGLLVSDVLDKGAPKLVGRVDFPDDRGSANNIRYSIIGNQPVVFLADGLGGFRVLAYQMSTSLQASKAYSPSVFYDALHYVNIPTRFKIPSELNVSNGNAGNHKAYLRFDSVVCTYQGGSSQSRPAPGSTQWTLGLKYKFVSCSNGSAAGASIRAENEVWLQVNNGHAGFSPTTITHNLEVISIEP